MKNFGGSLEKMAAAPTAATARTLALRCRVSGRKQRTRSCFTHLGHPVPVADEYLRRIAERHALLTPAPGRSRIAYEQLAELTRRAFARDPAAEQAAALQRISCADGRRGQGALRADGALRRLSSGRRSDVGCLLLASSLLVRDRDAMVTRDELAAGG